MSRREDRAQPPALAEYRRRRDFARTPEPDGHRSGLQPDGHRSGLQPDGHRAGPPRLGRVFVVQRHAARSLHHDLRLELGGVLLSWAVPKAITAGDRRLAVRTEDHPLGYADFEGVIPSGYGKGTVMLLDRGDWTTDEDPRRGIERGSFGFELFGQRLRGRWRLVRTRGGGGRRESWLLVPGADAEVAHPAAAAEPASVATGRTMAEIAAGKHAGEVGTALKTPERLDPTRLPGARAGRAPGVPPAWPAVRRAAEPPGGGGWLHEVWHEGLRLRVLAGRGGVVMLDDSGADRSGDLAGLAMSVADLVGGLGGGALALLAVAVPKAALPRGRTEPGEARAVIAAGRGDNRLCLLVVDVARAMRANLRGVPLTERKAWLRRVLESGSAGPAGAGRVVVGEHVAGRGAAVARAAWARGARAILSRDGEGGLPSGRGGWRLTTPPSGSGNRARGGAQDGTPEDAPARGALPMVMAGPRGVRVAGVVITNPDRVIDPACGATKLDLARHARRIAPLALPHVAGRPITLVRCPGGVAGACFYQREPGRGWPDAIRRVTLPGPGGPETVMAVDDAAGLVSLVQMGGIEVHPWGSRTETPDRPDVVVFDLDPGEGVPWAEVVGAARDTRDRLAEAGLATWVKTTGGKGLHLVAPIEPGPSWAQVKSFCRAVAAALARTEPSRFVAEMSKARRTGRVFVDYLRNQRGATAVAPYSARARPGLLVATPLAWKALRPSVAPGSFTPARVARRVAALRDDPWADWVPSPLPGFGGGALGPSAEGVAEGIVEAKR